MSRFDAALLLYNHIVEAKLLLFFYKIKYSPKKKIFSEYIHQSQYFLLYLNK